MSHNHLPAPSLELTVSDLATGILFGLNVVVNFDINQTFAIKHHADVPDNPPKISERGWASNSRKMFKVKNTSVAFKGLIG